jgi:very-short-patch-repair endonuclease
MGATENTFHSLAQAEGVDLVRGPAANWLTNLGHLNPSLNAAVSNDLRKLHSLLGGDATLLASKRSGAGPRLDFLLTDRNLVIEVDEIQHFTSDRLATLRTYADSANLGYDIERYCALIDRWRDRADRYRAAKPTIDFPFAGGRRAQRAYYDACRDLAAPQAGLRVLRIPAPECDGSLAYRRFQRALEQLSDTA